MALIDNVVHEQSTSTGSGNMTIGALNGRQRFSSAFSTGGSDTFYYSIMNQDAGEWEIGTGSLADANTLVRDTVLASSNSGLAVNFSAGTKDVINGIPQSDAALLSDLASTANGFGASLIGVEDSGALITATTVEGALAENRAAIDAIEADYLVAANIANMLETSDIGVTVQGYDADTAKYDDATANFTGTLQNGGSNVLVDSDIGSTVQAYDADLTTWAGITPGTDVGTALAVNVGTAGAFVVNGGALGTPATGTLTNCTGLPLTTGITGRVGITVQTFSASGTWTKPSGCIAAKFTLVGPGGGGGGAEGGAAGNSAFGGGGGSGGMSILYLNGATLAAISSLTVTIGTGGAGGAAGNNNGSNGSAASKIENGVTLLAQATAGSGGFGMATGNTIQRAGGGAPGTGSTGTINGQGEAGGTGFRQTVTQGVTGGGGGTIFGGGAPGAFNANAGSDAISWGGGGEGAGATTSDTAGGAGQDGFLLVEEYY